MKHRILCTSILAAGFAMSLQAGTQVNLGFETDASIETWLNGDNPSAGNNGTQTFYHGLNEDGVRYDMPTCGVNVAGSIPTFTTSEKKAGSRSLSLKIEPSTQTKDRLELRAIHRDKPNALTFNETRYFGYALYIHPQSQHPTGWLHFTQVWQLHIDSTDPQYQAPATGDIQAVPFTMSFLENRGSWKWRANARSENGSVNLGEGTVTTGWNTFIYAFKPRHTGSTENGSVKIWVNSTNVNTPTISWAGRWGVKPTLSGSGYSGSGTTMDIRVGMYREAQNKKQHFLLDQVKVGTAFTDVLP
jgi:hypothetical protein